jgi:hypothetical protein
LKQSGFHFGGNTAGLSQLEDFSITQMGRKIQDLAPNLWTLLGSLLDVEPDRRRTAPAEETIDEDTEMELADIATVVDGNDNGSDESEGEETEGEVEGGAAAASSEGATSDDCEDIVLMTVSGGYFFHYSPPGRFGPDTFIHHSIVPPHSYQYIYTVLYCSRALRALVTTGSVPFYHTSARHPVCSLEL